MAKFSIEWGVPEMWALRRELQAKFDADTLDADERLLFRKLQKAVLTLAENPRHPGLASHEISALSARYGQKVWQSYLENRKPAAGRAREDAPREFRLPPAAFPDACKGQLALPGDGARRGAGQRAGVHGLANAV